MLLADKVCLVAGAASPRGIGRAVVQLFAEHGAGVFVVDRILDEPSLAEVRREVSGTRRISGSRCDIRDADNCRAVVDQVVAEFGQIDCLVNAVGVVRAQPCWKSLRPTLTRWWT